MTSKLVRDRLLDRIPCHEIRRCDDDELEGLLDRKLDEEVSELRQAAFRDVFEFADVFEVLEALARRSGISPGAIAEARDRKRAEKGGFELGLVWTPGVR